MSLGRRTLGGLFAVAIAMIGVYGPVAPASGQTGYGDPCNPPTSTQNLGSLDVGATATYRLSPTPCTLNPGAALTVTVNGINIPGKVADANGTVLVTVRAVSRTQLEIDDPVNVAAVCGNNNIVVRGPSKAAANVTVNHTGTFNLVCPVAGGTVPRTGSSTLRWVSVATVLVALGAAFLAVERRRSIRWSKAG